MQDEELAQQEYQIPEDVLSVLPYFDGFTTKFYMHGFLHKKNESTPDGRPFKMRDWTRWYVELCGPVMIFWRATPEYTTSNVEKLKALVAPNFLNVSDSIVNVTQEQDGRKFVFSLNTSGANCFYMETGSFNELNDWVCAIRLSSYEMAKLHHMYTYVILTRPNFANHFSTYHTFTEGQLQIKYAGASQWRQCWAVLDNSNAASPGGPQVQFFEDNHSGPFLTLRKAYQAYSVYPERPELSDVSGIFKVEGTIDINIDNNGIRPEFIIMSAETPDDMARWVVAIFDAYKLLGRPEQLDIPPAPSDAQNLFLDVAQVNHLDMARNNSMDCKRLFENVLTGNNEPLHEQMMNMKLENAPKVTRTATKSSVSFAPNTKKNGKKPKAVLPSDSEESDEEVMVEESDSDDDDGLFISAPATQQYENTSARSERESVELQAQSLSKVPKAKKQLASESESDSDDGELFKKAPGVQQQEKIESIAGGESNDLTASASAKALKAKKQLASDSEEESDVDGTQQHEVGPTTENTTANLKVPKAKKQLASESEEDSDDGELFTGVRSTQQHGKYESFL
ncbi:hypothetical protein K493DRAFT_70856 [Basidiobolus meristosporus CBS 931.73]|uniref:PH domain-containing protein n=1 Tax=Basidiobolus meristosporus CBS 931.73 TaxID=1314790 RepID=A0A1Y1YZS2_9FUNG|nr:hypothetical protein K493DRAFT_70856 [Basidiobolus meristosporus CBS 931.73]|eukprot:ORY03364.1 hypothetical protein K493DRAFT_70856 [Basidiobolus meristosporus CBS 931.73]